MGRVRSLVGYLLRPRPRHPRTKHWIGSVLDARVFPPNRYVAAATLGVTHFLLGLVVASIGGFGSVYVTSVPMIVTAFFTGWVLAFGGYSDAALASLPESIRPAFVGLAPSDDLAAKHVHKLLYRRRTTLLPGAVAAGVGIAVVLGQQGFWSGWLAREFQADLGVVLVAANIAILALLGYSMIWGYVIYIGYTYQACKHETVASLTTARVYLRPVTNFGLATGLGWSIAVAALVPFFHRDLDRFAWATIATLGAMALILILLPQFLVHVRLDRGQQKLMREAADGLLAMDPGSAREYVTRVTRNDRGADAIQRFEEFIERTSSASTWIHSPRDAAALLGEVLIPVVAVVITVVA